ncbi:hypothetical protein HZB04_00280 [Candidatus Wolfebacteria bacterium]|nr:hypothetical protein [Candidatus Wolfebacteria bacterium]
MKKHRAIIFCFVLFLLSAFCFLLSASFAFESTSTNFEIHAGAVDSVAGFGTSTSFQNISAGGQLATGSSTVSGGSARRLLSGVLYWLGGFFTPRYDQIHYRWRNDNGNEASATWRANEDTQILNVSKATTTRLRFEVSNEGWRTGGSPQFKIEYASTTTCSSGTYTAIPAIAATEHWQMATSSYVNDGDATTNVASGLTDENATFTAGQVKTTGNMTSAITLTPQNFTEIEYGILATSTANNGGTYCFRLTDNGSTVNFNYSQYPTAVLGGGGYQPIGTIESPVFDTGAANGVGFNFIMASGTTPTGAKFRMQLATSNSSGGPWNYLGPNCADTTYYFDAAFAPFPGIGNSPATQEIGCPNSHNNKRYFRYKLILCSGDCSAGGSDTPQIDKIIVNWSP